MLSKIYRSVIYVSLISGLASYNPVLAIITQFIKLTPPLSSGNTAAQENTQEQNTRDIDLSGEGSSSGNSQSIESYTMPEIECFSDIHVSGPESQQQAAQLTSSLAICNHMKKDRFVITEDMDFYDPNKFLPGLQSLLAHHGIAAANAECRKELTIAAETTPIDDPHFLQPYTESEQLASTIHKEALIALEQASMHPRFKPRVKEYLDNILRIIQKNSSFINTFIHQNHVYKGKTLYDLKDADLNQAMVSYVHKQGYTPLLIDQSLIEQRPLVVGGAYFSQLFDLSALKFILQNWNRRNLVICAGHAHINRLEQFFQTIFHYTESDRQGYADSTYPCGSSPDGTVYYSKNLLLDFEGDYSNNPKKEYLTKDEMNSLEKLYNDYPALKIKSYPGTNNGSAYHLEVIDIARALLTLKPRWTKPSERPCEPACTVFSAYKPKKQSTLTGQARTLPKTPAPEKIVSTDNAKTIHGALQSYLSKS